MTLQEYWRIFRRRWLIVFLAVLAGIGISGAIYVVQPPEYTASLQMYVSAQPTQDPQLAFQGAQLSGERVKSYTKLGTSQRVADEVVRRLRLPVTGQDLASHILTSSEVDEVVIDMFVTDSSPQRAADIANTAATVLSEVVDDLERPQTPNGIAPVAVRVVQPATVPVRPSSTGLTKTLALGLLTGLALGVGAALVRNAMDTSVTSLEQLEILTGVPVLGSVAFDRHTRNRPLVALDDPNGPRSEAFRQLRTNLQSVNGTGSPQVLLFTSATHGEGKTTTVVNLATALGSVGKRVLVIEADLRDPRLADLLKLDGDVGLIDVLMNRATSEQAVKRWGDTMVSVMPSGSSAPNPTELLAGPHMKALVVAMRGRYDVILIDTPPLLPVTDAAAVASVTDGVVLVCKFGKTSSPEVVGAVTALRSAHAPVLGTVLTSMPPSRTLPLLNRGAPPASHPRAVPMPAGGSMTVMQDPVSTLALRQLPPREPRHAVNGEGWRPSPRPAPK